MFLRFLTLNIIFNETIEGRLKNPAKVTDTRFLSYMRKYGKDSWELDALEPKFIDSLLRNHITEVIDFDIWDTMIEAEHKDKEKLYALSSKL